MTSSLSSFESPAVDTAMAGASSRGEQLCISIRENAHEQAPDGPRCPPGSSLPDDDGVSDLVDRLAVMRGGLAATGWCLLL